MSKIDYSLIGKRLKEARDRKQLTLEDAGKSVNVNKSTILRWENGETERFKIPTLETLANLYDVNPEWLMGHDVPMTNITSENNINKIPLLSNFENTLKNSIQNNCIGYLPVNHTSENYFALQIQKDNSMAPILDIGDIAIVHLQTEYSSGQTFLISLDKEIIIRKILKLSDSIELQALNPYYPAITLKEKDFKKRNFKIIGRITKSEIESFFV